MTMHLRYALGCALAGSLFVAALASAQTPATRVRGTIDKVAGQEVTVTSREGPVVAIKLADNARISAVAKATLADVKPGSYVGIAALPRPDGSQMAIEVLIFPEAMRGAGEGHRPWDLMPESTMTNATVADSVGSVDGKAMTLTYKGGSQKITVPPDAPVVTFAPGTVAELVPGATVFLSAEQMPDGTMRASRVTVGRGIAPPM